MSRNIHCTYVSEKLSKIRWRPSSLSEPNSFITGSWDNRVNNIRLWEIRPRFMQQENNPDEEEEINPCEIRDVAIDSDITELKFINSDAVVVSTSKGDVYLFKVTSNEGYDLDLTQEMCWKQLHKLPNDFTSSCTFALYESDIATAGEDGRIHLLSMNSNEPTSTIENADSCTIHCLEFLRYNELLTANERGLLKIWDLRNNANKAEQSFLLREDTLVVPTALAYHPTQRHIIMAGDESGTITIWDLRQNTHPVNVLTQHQEPVSEIVFHQDRPDQFFSSGGGDVFQWSGQKQTGMGSNSLWYLLSGESSKYDIYRLMPELYVPVNSIDLSRDKLLCAGDNEAMYLIENVNVYNLYPSEVI